MTYARRYDEAAQQLERLVALNPDSAVGTFWYLGRLEVDGNNSEAFARLMRFHTLAKTDEKTRQLYKRHIKHRVGREFCASVPNGFMNTTWQFFLEGIRIKRLNIWKNHIRSEICGWAYLQADPRLDSLRGDPRFDEMVRRVGLPQ